MAEMPEFGLSNAMFVDIFRIRSQSRIRAHRMYGFLDYKKKQFSNWKDWCKISNICEKHTVTMEGVDSMPKRIRFKPSKPSSLLGMIVGIVFVFLGVTMAIPDFGVFGVFWTLIAIGITGYHAYNFFGEKGVASWEIDIDNGFKEVDKGFREENNGDFEIRLRKLNRLKEEGLITEEEFRKKREEILREKW